MFILSLTLLFSARFINNGVAGQGMAIFDSHAWHLRMGLSGSYGNLFSNKPESNGWQYFPGGLLWQREKGSAGQYPCGSKGDIYNFLVATETEYFSHTWFVIGMESHIVIKFYSIKWECSCRSVLLFLINISISII